MNPNPAIDYYALLGIPSTANEEEITKAFRKRILQVHLDKLPQGQDTKLCYQTIEAHRMLSNKQLRTKYDILRDTLLKTQVHLSDSELIDKYRDKYKNGLPSIEQLRAQYEMERVAAMTAKVNVPAICYDVGKAQLSKHISQRISEWEAEFDESCFSDNYFESLSAVFGSVLEQPASKSASKEYSWHCNLCDEDFLDSSHHWTAILLPYVNYLSIDHISPNALTEFYETSIGPLFSWDPHYLPPKPSGIWGNSQVWSGFPKIQRNVIQLLTEFQKKFGDSKDNHDFSKMRINGRGEEFGIVCWALQTQSSMHELIEKANELLFNNEIDDLLSLGCTMKELGLHDWRGYINKGLKSGQLELAMFWTIFGNLVGNKNIPSWYDLGMKIQNEHHDTVLAHFCFLIGGFDMVAIAGIFAKKGNYYAAADWYLNSGRMKEFLDKPIPKVSQFNKSTTVVPDKIPDNFYSIIYYSIRIKCLLQLLKSEPCLPKIEELVELTLKLCPANTQLEGLKLIASTFPRFNVDCHSIHRAVIKLLKGGKIDFISLTRMLAAYHFLPLDEFNSDFINSTSIQFMRNQLEKSLATCDFESITDVLLNLCKRNVQAAESLLQELKLPNDDETEKQQLSPANQAIHLLISGTIHRVKCNWLDSMVAYQNALLSTPECLYRLVPAVSKLTQNEHFHESILNAVQLEVKQLKEFFDFEEYLEIDSSVHSLVVSDPIPTQEFGYQEKSNRIQSVDPEALKAQAQQQTQVNEPHIETNTPLITMTKNERAIEEVGEGQSVQQALNAAFGYMDLIKALPEKSQNGPIVMSASHLLRAMDYTSDPSSLFAYRNAIYEMAQSLFKLFGGAKNGTANVQSCLSHKHMFSIMVMANQKLSRSLHNNDRRDSKSSSSSSDSSGESEEWITRVKKSESFLNINKGQGQKNEDNDDSSEATTTSSSKQTCNHLISKSDSQLITDYLSSIVHFPKIEPLVNIPTLNCSDLQYVETIVNQFMLQYCRDKLTQPSATMKDLQAYTLFTEVRSGRSDLMEFEVAKEKAMECLLETQGWSLGQVQNLLDWSIGRFTPEGWTDVENVGLCFKKAMAFRSIDGFVINYETCQISFLLSKPLIDDECNLFDSSDLAEIFEKGIETVDLTFENPQLHPCQQINFTSSLAGTEYLRTILRVALLINYFATGLELNVKSPFYIRNAALGLTSRLPEHLQFFCRPIKLRSGTGFNLNRNTYKFWLKLTEVYFEDETNDSIFTYKVGNLATEIKPETLEDADGVHEEIDEDFAQFAHEFTRNYDEIGLYFPELLRLKELYKISLIYKKLKEILSVNNALIAQNGKSQKEIFRLTQLCTAIQNLGISLNSGGEDEVCDKKHQNAWIPSLGCHNLYPNANEIVQGGVSLKLEPSFGPVSDTLNSKLVPSSSLFDQRGKIETEINVELKNTKSYHYLNIVKEALAASDQKCWWTSAAVNTQKGNEIETNNNELDKLPASETVWRYVQSSEELYYNDNLVYKGKNYKNTKLNHSQSLACFVVRDEGRVVDLSCFCFTNDDEDSSMYDSDSSYDDTTTTASADADDEDVNCKSDDSDEDLSEPTTKTIMNRMTRRNEIKPKSRIKKHNEDDSFSDSSEESLTFFQENKINGEFNRHYDDDSGDSDSSSDSEAEMNSHQAEFMANFGLKYVFETENPGPEISSRNATRFESDFSLLESRTDISENETDNCESFSDDDDVSATNSILDDDEQRYESNETLDFININKNQQAFIEKFSNKYFNTTTTTVNNLHQSDGGYIIDDGDYYYDASGMYEQNDIYETQHSKMRQSKQQVGNYLHTTHRMKKMKEGQNLDTESVSSSISSDLEELPTNSKNSDSDDDNSSTEQNEDPEEDSDADSNCDNEKEDKARVIERQRLKETAEVAGFEFKNKESLLKKSYSAPACSYPKELQEDDDEEEAEEEDTIQKGVYSISNAYTDPSKGPLTMRLELIQATLPEDVENKEEGSCSQTPADAAAVVFYIHGVNRNHHNFDKLRSKSEQEISIILPSNIRKRISSSVHKCLLVE